MRKVSGWKQRLQLTTGKTMRNIPCDIYEGKYGAFLMPGMLQTIHKIDTEEEEGSFLDALIEAEPSFEYIFQELPHAEEDRNAISEFMIQGKLNAGSDDGDDQNGRIVFAMVFASDDLIDQHVSGHEAYGLPKDSGRAEIMGVTEVIIYLCQIISWYYLPNTLKTTIHCDNAEAVQYVNKLWIGETPKWADGRNIELKRTIQQKLQEVGKGLRIEHVHGHQDKRIPFDELSLPSKVNVICDREYTQELGKESRVLTQERKRPSMIKEKACLVVDGIPVTEPIGEALLK